MGLLEIKNLRVCFDTIEGELEVLRGINLNIKKGEIVGLVGESGCGKTLTALSIIRLLPKTAFIKSGEIYLEGTELVKLSKREMENIRGKKIGMIFQEPSSYLNPLYTAGNQVEEAIKEDLPKIEKRKRVFEIFEEVGLNRSDYFKYPHQLSGGMQQRVMISMALINRPVLLLADEPTTALDVTTEAQIINLLRKLIEKYMLSVLFITHDISLAKSFVDRIAVMYAGQIVEIGDSKEIFEDPLHPYTKGLVMCLPERYKRGERIRTIGGNVADFKNLPNGCAFHPRCPLKRKICEIEDPEEKRIGNRIVRCHEY
ncbi:MAG: ABC transporter ATP-binding protein [Candidatus Omnitrophota bacterium]|nr:MAG: ABC transporter ATP-binding protein [Candidatus Omnitrophota bacterium]